MYKQCLYKISTDKRTDTFSFGGWTQKTNYFKFHFSTTVKTATGTQCDITKSCTCSQHWTEGSGDNWWSSCFLLFCTQDIDMGIFMDAECLNSATHDCSKTSASLVKWVNLCYLPVACMWMCFFAKKQKRLSADQNGLCRLRTWTP